MIIRIFLYVIVLLGLSSCKSKSVVGAYKDAYDDFYDCRVKIEDNHTYFYSCYSHLAGGGWSYGTWDLKKQTLYFTTKALYDIIRLKNKDTLVLSLDRKPDLFKDETKNYKLLLSLYKTNRNTSAKKCPNIPTK